MFPLRSPWFKAFMQPQGSPVRGDTKSTLDPINPSDPYWVQQIADTWLSLRPHDASGWEWSRTLLSSWSWWVNGFWTSPQILSHWLRFDLSQWWSTFCLPSCFSEWFEGWVALWCGQNHFYCGLSYLHLECYPPEQKALKGLRYPLKYLCMHLWWACSQIIPGTMTLSSQVGDIRINRGVYAPRKTKPLLRAM